MASSSPKRVPRGKPKQYTTCHLYNTEAATKKLTGLTFATCNPVFDKRSEVSSDVDVKTEIPPYTEAAQLPQGVQEKPQFTVSDRMSCNYCDIVFSSRLDQKRHYRSDWHRYNLKQRLKGKESVAEEQFWAISGNVSSISGSDSDTGSESESTDKETKTRSKPTGIPTRLRASGYSSTDSDSDTDGTLDAAARRLPKVYFRNGDGELVSLYRSVIHHKKKDPATSADLFSMATDLPNHMTWAIFMAGGGHFAGAVFNKDELLLHKTFHRYVVRAKRGTAQTQRDAQGNAPKSAGASLRRYNEAALTQEIQELISSWREQVDACDVIFLRAPSFNRRIFFSGKFPPLRKDDMRIRLIPLQTKRPTFNEVRRVYELLASIECYGDEADITDFIPVSPPQTFNTETGQLRVLDETELSPKHRKLWNKKIGNSPLSNNPGATEACTDVKQDSGLPVIGDNQGDGSIVKEKLKSLTGQIREEEKPPSSSGTSTASETELVETMETINLMELKEFAATKKPKRRKKQARKRKNSLKYQTEPESNVFDEEKYHLKNNLYTASKTGDIDTLRNLLAIFPQPQRNPGISQTGQSSYDQHFRKLDSGIVRSCDQQENAGNLDDTDLDDKAESVCDTGQNVGQAGQDIDQIAGDVFSQMGSFVWPVSPLEKVSKKKKRNMQEKLTDVTSQAADLRTNTKQVDEVCDQAAQIDTEHYISGKVDVILDPCIKTDCDLLKTDEHEYITTTVSQQSSIQSSETCTDSNGTVKRLDIKPATSANVQLPDLSPVVTVALLNESFGDNDTSLLHVASREGHKGAVTLLMEAGADPAVRDKGGLTPYMVAKDKPTRNEFRKFISNWPGRYDYITAQIPSPLTEEQEAEKKLKEMEKKKAQKKARQERQKVKRAEEEATEREEREKRRFLQLSDSEKRALAAEKRFLAQASRDGVAQPVLSRCFFCGTDMTGKVPFEYMAYKFCTSQCLQEHRRQNKTR